MLSYVINCFYKWKENEDEANICNVINHMHYIISRILRTLVTYKTKAVSREILLTSRITFLKPDHSKIVDLWNTFNWNTWNSHIKLGNTRKQYYCLEGWIYAYHICVTQLFGHGECKCITKHVNKKIGITELHKAAKRELILI